MKRLFAAALVAVGVFAGSVAFAVPTAEAATLQYEIYDHYDFISGGDPFDKNFSVSGTITAQSLGYFRAGDNPFQSWNITEVVRMSGQPDATYSFTQANSAWTLEQVTDQGLPVLEITEDFIWLLDWAVLLPQQLDVTNDLILTNTGANQLMEWVNPPGSTLPYLFFSATITPETFNGIYSSYGGGKVLIASRVSPVPLPAGALLLLSALGGLGFVGWRRKRAVAA